MKTFIFIIALVCLGFLSTRAQSPCPPSDQGCGPWMDTTLGRNNGTAAASWSADIRYRICNGVIQVRYSELRMYGFYAMLTDTGIYESRFSTAMEFIDLELMSMEMLGIYSGKFNLPRPACPDSALFVQFYSASCGIWLRCSYELERDSLNRVCDQGYEGIFPDYRDGDMLRVDVWKWQPCGETCCERSYSICWQNGPDSMTIDPHIVVRGIERRKLTPCSEEPSVNNPAPKYTKPCLDGC